MNLFTISDLTKEYGEGEAKIAALKKISLTIPEGKFIVILGASGSGKSTMLNMLGCMDRATAGTIQFMGDDITVFNKRQMTAFRSAHIGFVFQSYNLLPDLTALENVEFSTELANLSRAEAENALCMVGLSERMNHYPAELSGGEQQRVSIARAIAKNPKLLLCDEPTGALDYKTGKQVLKTLQDTCINTGTTVILITHNSAVAPIANRVIYINDAKVRNIDINENPMSIDDIEW